MGSELLRKRVRKLPQSPLELENADFSGRVDYQFDLRPTCRRSQFLVEQQSWSILEPQMATS